MSGEDAAVDVVVTEQALRGDLPKGLEHVVCVDADREQMLDAVSMFSDELTEAILEEQVTEPLIHEAYEHYCRAKAWKDFQRIRPEKSELHDRKFCVSVMGLVRQRKQQSASRHLQRRPS